MEWWRVCGVIKSLKEEISSSNRGEEVWIHVVPEMDEMSYLIMASDDDLNILPSSSMYEDAYSIVTESQDQYLQLRVADAGTWVLFTMVVMRSYENHLLTCSKKGI